MLLSIDWQDGDGEQSFTVLVLLTPLVSPMYCVRLFCPVLVSVQSLKNEHCEPLRDERQELLVALGGVGLGGAFLRISDAGRVGEPEASQNPGERRHQEALSAPTEKCGGSSRSA